MTSRNMQGEKRKSHKNESTEDAGLCRMAVGGSGSKGRARSVGERRKPVNKGVWESVTPLRHELSPTGSIESNPATALVAKKTRQNDDGGGGTGRRGGKRRRERAEGRKMEER